MRMIAVIVAAVLAAPAAAQEPPKPGPEHKLLKSREGTWDITMKAGGMEHKGTVTYKMELGGLWLVGSLESDLGGEKFYGKSLDTYDAGKKKYVGVWADSMSTALEIGMALAAFVGILSAKPRDWITFAVSLLAMLIIAGLTIRNTPERKH